MLRLEVDALGLRFEFFAQGIVDGWTHVMLLLLPFGGVGLCLGECNDSVGV